MSFAESLTFMGNLIWLSYGVSLFLIYRLLSTTKLSKSLLISMVIIVVINLLMIGHRELLLWWDKLNGEPSMLLNFAWYIGFTIFYMVGILALFYTHKKENVLIGKFGQYVSFSFCCSALLQLVQYTEIVLYKTVDKVGNIYTYGIPAINIGTAIIALSLALIVNYFVYVKKNGLQVIEQWSI